MHTTFIHLSDTHILPPGEQHLGADPTANLRAVLGCIEAMQVEPAFVLISGDLTNGGEPEAYEQLTALTAEITERLGAPVLLNLGNHDKRIPFRQVVLGERAATDEAAPYYYSRTFGDLRVFMLDSKIPGEIHGLLGEAQLAWLADQLQNPAPSDNLGGNAGGDLIVVHHPVTPRGIPRHNDYLLADRQALHDLLVNKPILGILVGHSHASTATTFAGTMMVTAPGISMLADPSIRAGGRFLAGAGFNLCTVREGRLIVNPVILPGDQRELYRYFPKDLDAHKANNP